MMQRFAPLRNIILLLSWTLLTSCQFWQQDLQKKPHVIVVAVESLSFEMASCLEDSDDNDGFSTLCQDSLRFTHVYTPSTLSQSSLASLLSGKSSKDHRVFHNGNQFIPPHIQTVAEQALQQGYQTLFLSGGPPILAKSGLAQGFEIFNDEFLSDGGLYRPAHQLFKTAVNTLKQNKEESQFITIFVSDLQFPFLSTKSDEGREREKTLNAQRLEVGESLHTFIQDLKNAKLWDNSYLIVLGLNGAPDQVRRGVLWRENLFRENVHVPVFIKTPKTDPIATTELVDQLMSLEDIGHVLNQLVATQIKTESSVKDWLAPAESRKYIEVRSDWGAWWFSRPSVLSLRTYEYLIFPYERLRIYNSIEDRTESVALSATQIGTQHFKWLDFRMPEVIESKETIAREIPDLYVVLQKVHWNRYSKGSASGDQINEGRGSEVSTAILNDQMVWKKNWQNLMRSSDKDSLIYYVASKNMGNRNRHSTTKACEIYFNFQRKGRGNSRCSDELFLSLLDWENSLEDSEEAVAMEKNFMRKFRTFLINKKLAYANLINELNWDINTLKYYGPSYAELYLNLPEKAALRKKVEGYKISLTGEFL